MGLAKLASAEGQRERAAQALLDRTSTVLEPANRSEFNQELAALRTQLGEETFTAAWADGRAMSLEQAMALALKADAGAS